MKTWSHFKKEVWQRKQQCNSCKDQDIAWAMDFLMSNAKNSKNVSR